MRGRALAGLSSLVLLLGWGWLPLRGGDWPRLAKVPEPGAETTLIQFARAMDAVEERIRDDGVVVIKHPDVWGQSRMTLYRKDFERMMNATGPGDFHAILSARIARLDAASFESQTSLSASLAGSGGGGGGRRRAAPATAGHGSASAVTSPTVVAITPPAAAGSSSSGSSSGGSSSGGSSVPPPALKPTSDFWDNKPLPMDAPFALLPGGKPFSDVDSTMGGKLGLDPPVFLDEKKRFFDHLNEIRRVNVGDDNADSAGYGLYLVRMPISIQPGECTRKGHGAVLTVTARHEFEPDFLHKTYKQLVINDLIDQLSPIVYELIRAGVVPRLERDLPKLEDQRKAYFNQRMDFARRAEQLASEEKRLAPTLVKSRLDEAEFDRGFERLKEGLNGGVAQVNQLTALLAPEGLPKTLDKLLTQLEDDVVKSIQEALAETLFPYFSRRYQPLIPVPNQNGRVFAKSSFESELKKAGEIILFLKNFRSPDSDLDDAMSSIREDLQGLNDPWSKLSTKDVDALVDQWIRKAMNELHPTSLSVRPVDPVALRAKLTDGIAAIIKNPGAFKHNRPAGPRSPSDVIVDGLLQSFQDFDAPVSELKRQVAKFKDDLEKKDFANRFSKDVYGRLNSLNQILQKLKDGKTTPLETDLAAAEIEQISRGLPAVLDFLKTYSPMLRAYGASQRTNEALKKEQDALAKAREVSENSWKWLDQGMSSIKELQSAVQIEKVAASAFPSTRFGARVYPVAPSDVEHVYLRDALFTLARKTGDALSTEIPRATDVRSYLYHELNAAYDLLKYYECDVEPIADAIEARDYPRLRNDAFPRLTARLPGDLQGKPEDPVSILCWCVAVECGLLNRHLQKDMAATEGRGGFSAPDAPALLFYQDQPPRQAEAVFERYVRARWPMVVFALDPFVDQQNIADAFSLRRDLQLAVAFSFATGKINFSQLDQFNHKIEQDAETIALNRTVTSFSHGDETFGWRFYPRYQNPPNESSNIQVIGNMLWRGGPGRDYQLKNAKLEAGQRELTAVIIMPSILQRVRFEVTGNWFPLHDPDEIKVPTARMLQQGRQVVALKQALQTAQICARDRPDDLERLSTRVDQIEAMLPMQTRRVSVPYENSLGGFQLFTPGTNALVPEVTGFEGVESIVDGQATDIVIFGRHFSLHESKVVVGGRVLVPYDQALDKTMVEIVSREVMHLKVPAGVRPTVIRNLPKSATFSKAATPRPVIEIQPTQKYVELFVATPNGISNRLLIPFREKTEDFASSTPPPSSTPGYVLLDDALTIEVDSAPITAGKSFQPKPRPAPETRFIRIKPLITQADSAPDVDVEITFAIENDVMIRLTASGIPLRNGVYALSKAQLDPMAADLLLKLDGLGKLTGDKSVSKLVSQSIVIKTTGPKATSQTTYNDLTIDLVLFAQPVAPAQAVEKAPGGSPSSPDPNAKGSTTPPAAATLKTSWMSSPAAPRGGRPPSDAAVAPATAANRLSIPAPSSIPPPRRLAASTAAAAGRPAGKTRGDIPTTDNPAKPPKRGSFFSRLVGRP